MSFNKVILIGNLTRDPELRSTAGGASVCQFGLATNRKYKRADGETAEDVCFADVTVWGRTGETVAQYMRKGSAILVEGRLALDTWEDRQTGQKRSKLYVVGENVRFMDGGNRDDGGDGRGCSRQGHPAQRPPQGRPAPQRPAMPAFQGPDEPEPLHDDIPF